MRYWDDRCLRCGHIRGHHGEGGCTAMPSLLQRLFRTARSSTVCGCRVPQNAIEPYRVPPS